MHGLKYMLVTTLFIVLLMFMEHTCLKIIWIIKIGKKRKKKHYKIFHLMISMTTEKISIKSMQQ